MYQPGLVVIRGGGAWLGQVVPVATSSLILSHGLPEQIIILKAHWYFGVQARVSRCCSLVVGDNPGLAGYGRGDDIDSTSARTLCSVWMTHKKGLCFNCYCSEAVGLQRYIPRNKE